MLLKKISTYFFFGVFISISSVYAISPEETCFQNLNQQISNSSVFSNINLEQLTKKNGPDDDLVSSKPFSAKTYNDFLNLTEIPVPMSKSFINQYPDNISIVPNDYLTTIPKYKQNRANVQFILGNDNLKTPIGDPNKDGVQDFINGYYIDSKVLTFGRSSDLMYPFPSRKAVPSPGKGFPFGRPYADMREYVIFTQHLAPKFGGNFISCGIAKLVPEGDYALASWNGEKSISPFYYGGAVMQGSDASTHILPIKNGYKFRATETRSQVNSKEIIDGNVSYDHPLMHFNALVIAYDNSSNFYNEFITHGIITEVSTKPAYQSKGVAFIKKEEIKALKNRSNLGILGGAITAYNPSSKLFASLIQNVLASNETTKEPYQWGGAALNEGVPFETIDKIDKIEDENLRILLTASISPGMQDYYEAVPEEKRTPFEKAYLKQPLTYEEKLENVNYILNNTEDITALNTENLKYKDISFGNSVLSIEDVRVKKIRSKSYLKDEAKRLLAEKNTQLASLKIAPNMDTLARQEILNKKEELEREYMAKISKLYNFEDEFIKFKVDYFDLKNQKNVGRITEDEFDQKVKNLYQEFETKSNRSFLKDVLTEENKKALSDDLLERKSLKIKTKKTKKINNIISKYQYYTFGGLFFIIAVILALFGLKVIRKSNQII